MTELCCEERAKMLVSSSETYHKVAAAVIAVQELYIYKALNTTTPHLLFIVFFQSLVLFLILQVYDYI